MGCAYRETELGRVLKTAVGCLTLAALVASAVFAGGAGAATAGHAAASGGTVVANISTAPATLDPVEECGTYDFVITNAVYSRLTQYGTVPGPDGTTQTDYSTIEPSLATSWTIGDGGLVYTFHLRSGVKFADGKPVTSADVKYSFERAITMNGCGAYFVLDGHYTPPLIKSIATASPLSVVITLSVPDAEVLSDWAQPAASIVEPSLVDANGGVVKNKVNTWMAGHVTAGAGPFLLSSYQPDVSATLVANPNYWQKPEASKIILNFISNPATLALDARHGEADITYGLPDAAVHSLASTPGIKVASYSTPESEQFGFNNQLAPFNNVKVREALDYAVPSAQILQKVVFGYGVLFYGEFQPSMAGYDGSLERPLPFDLTKAKALLASSGVSLPISFSVDVDAGDSAAAEIAQILQSIWAQLNVKMSINTLSPTDYINTIEEYKDSSYIRLDGPGVPEPAYYLNYDVVCGISFNLTQMCVPAIDRLIKKANTLPSSQQQPYWNAIEKLWNADYPKIQLYNFRAPVVLSSKVTSFAYSYEIGGLQYWGAS
jgi:peptide/nickel transport system substrate-binding protein